MMRFILIAAVALLPASTAIGAGEQAMPLAGTAWRPVALSGLAGTAEAPVFVRFQSADRVAGFAGCNRFSGSYEQKGDRLTIGPLVTTRMACARAAMEHEAKFLKVLNDVRLIDANLSELALKTWQGAVFLRLEPHGG